MYVYANYPMQNSDGMKELKGYLEQHADSLTAAEYLPYYALPYIPAPSSHPSFTHLFAVCTGVWHGILSYPIPSYDHVVSISSNESMSSFTMFGQRSANKTIHL